MKDSHTRSLVKGISWRVIGTIDTIVISFFVTGTLGKALTIGMTEVITKIILFYFHERLWQIFGHKMPDGSKKAIIKAISWRITGTIDTIFLSFMIITFGSETGNTAHPFAQATTIGSIELATKITLFYFHERIWNRLIKWGRVSIESNNLGNDENTAPNKNELAN
jgi:uncharacterized membrane protein